MRSKYLILISIMLLLIVPAMAEVVEITAEPLGGTINSAPSGQTNYIIDVSGLQRNAIQRISVDIPSDTTVDYTVWYGNGSTLTGQLIYEPTSTGCIAPPFVPLLPTLGCQRSYVSIGSGSSEVTYFGSAAIGRIDIVGYGREMTDPENPVYGYIVYDTTAGIHVNGDAMAFTPVSSGVIYKFQLTSTKPLTGVAYYTNTRENVQKAAKTSLVDTLLEFATLLNQTKDSVLEVFWFFYYLAEFLWDNLTLIIVLYFSLTGAMAIYKSNNSIFKAIQTWLKYQKALLDFILGLWDTLIGIVTKILK